MTFQVQNQHHASVTDSGVQRTSTSTANDRPDMESRWLCDICGQIVGPVTIETVREMLQRGELTAADRVRSELDEQWQTMESLVPNVALASVANQIVEEVLFAQTPRESVTTPDSFLSQLASDMEDDFECVPPPSESNTDSQMAMVTPVSQPQLQRSTTHSATLHSAPSRGEVAPIGPASRTVSPKNPNIGMPQSFKGQLSVIGGHSRRGAASDSQSSEVRRVSVIGGQ